MSFIHLCLLGMCLIILAFKILLDSFLVIHRRKCLLSGELLRLTCQHFCKPCCSGGFGGSNSICSGMSSDLSELGTAVHIQPVWAAFCLQVHIYIYLHIKIYLYWYTTYRIFASLLGLRWPDWLYVPTHTSMPLKCQCCYI